VRGLRHRAGGPTLYRGGRERELVWGEGQACSIVSCLVTRMVNWSGGKGSGILYSRVMTLAGDTPRLPAKPHAKAIASNRRCGGNDVFVSVSKNRWLGWIVNKSGRVELWRGAKRVQTGPCTYVRTNKINGPMCRSGEGDGRYSHSQLLHGASAPHALNLGCVSGGLRSEPYCI
jgi:hypothetical protein